MPTVLTKAATCVDSGGPLIYKFPFEEVKVWLPVAALAGEGGL